MSPPDYREAACCFNCWHHANFGDRCTKYGGSVDSFCVCAGFASAQEIEKEDKP